MELDDSLAGSVRAKLDAVDWETVIPKLTLYAYRRLGRRRPERAEELAQEAIAELYDPTCVQARKAGGTTAEVLFALCGLVNGLVMNDRRRKRNTHEIPVKTFRELNAFAGGETPEDLLIAAEERREAMALLRRRVTANDNEGALPVLIDLMDRGIDDAATQAKASGLPITDIRNARKRLFRLADAVAVERERETNQELS